MLREGDWGSRAGGARRVNGGATRGDQRRSRGSRNRRRRMRALPRRPAEVHRGGSVGDLCGRPCRALALQAADKRASRATHDEPYANKDTREDNGRTPSGGPQKRTKTAYSHTPGGEGYCLYVPTAPGHKPAMRAARHGRFKGSRSKVPATSQPTRATKRCSAGVTWAGR